MVVQIFDFAKIIKIQRLLKRFCQLFKNQLTDSDKYQIENIEKKKSKVLVVFVLFFENERILIQVYVYCHLKYLRCVISFKKLKVFLIERISKKRIYEMYDKF